jgi:hypothetical protein
MADLTPQERNFREETERNPMKGEPLTAIERKVESWPGVTIGDTGRGGLQFNYGRVELGHLHGSSFADLPFPKKVRDELIASGRASVHDPLPNSGWVRRRMDGPGDTEAVIELFRMNYDRARARAKRHAAQTTGPRATSEDD